MTDSRIRNKKLKIQLGFEPDTGRRVTAIPSTPAESRPATSTIPRIAAPIERSIYGLTFEEYKAANLDVQQQHDLIGQIRHEIPLIERDEIDAYLLTEAAKQLEMYILPMCKMMHVDPKAVKTMLDEQRSTSWNELSMPINRTLVEVWCPHIEKFTTCRVKNKFMFENRCYMHMNYKWLPTDQEATSV
ncbi:hypothetical protein DE146DRAFT_279333 [Phaeosphaeria sp. MPI-PUGE-AT-0046c]|nr:hypothetical protein DE146DRAFT_279333 [Phaeosphaeria sp. MPI-PUGE-AT-0046c]